MELINKNAVIGSLNVVKEIAQGDLHMLIAVKALIETINEMPTVDAVPVIRCKNCTHWDGYFCHNKYWGDGYGNYTPPIKSEDGFCDWAEGKENGKID